MKALLWDMDGTLVDTEHLWGEATYGMAKEMGRPLTPEIRALTIGGTLTGTIRICANYAGLPINASMIDQWTQWMMSTMEELFSGELHFRPGVPELLAQASEAGVPMALITNTHRRLTTVALASIHRTLGDDIFALTLCSDEVSQGKPAPDIYEEATRRLGLRPDNCLVIEDSATGMTAAYTAGCRVVGVPVEEGTQVPAEVTELSSLRPGHSDLRGLGLEDLRSIYDELGTLMGRKGASVGAHDTIEPVSEPKNFESLFAELRAKADQRPEDSSTVKALDAGVHFQGKKIVEEAGEVWLAAEYQSKEELAEEISQLIYWLQVAMIGRGLEPQDIYRYL